MKWSGDRTVRPPCVQKAGYGVRGGGAGHRGSAVERRGGTAGMQGRGEAPLVLLLTAERGGRCHRSPQEPASQPPNQPVSPTRMMATYHEAQIRAYLLSRGAPAPPPPTHRTCARRACLPWIPPPLTHPLAHLARGVRRRRQHSWELRRQVLVGPQQQVAVVAPHQVAAAFGAPSPGAGGRRCSARAPPRGACGAWGLRGGRGQAGRRAGEGSRGAC
jgi:hypothetical protein